MWKTAMEYISTKTGVERAGRYLMDLLNSSFHEKLYNRGSAHTTLLALGGPSSPLSVSGCYTGRGSISRCPLSTLLHPAHAASPSVILSFPSRFERNR